MPLDVSAELRRLYDITTEATRDAVQGTVTRNLEVSTDQGRLFLKIYPEGADLTAEESVLQLTDWLGDHGVPTPRLLRTRHGTVLARTERHAFSLWEHVDGEAAGALTGPLLQEIGTALGTMHRELAATGGYSGIPPVVQRPELDLDQGRKSWWTLLEGNVDRHLDPAQLNWLGEVRDDHLARLDELDALVRDHPAVTHQVTHGDLASPNVMVHQDHLRAFIDFAPPVARPVTYDLSRIGLDPRSVLSQPGWAQDFLGFLDAYAETNPGAGAADLWSSVRYGVIYVAKSTYPYGRLAAGGDGADETLWSYGRDRHNALVEIWPHLANLEDAVRTAR